MVSRLLLLPVWSIRLRQMSIGWRLVAVVQPTSGAARLVRAGILAELRKLRDPLPDDEAKGPIAE